MAKLAIAVLSFLVLAQAQAANFEFSGHWTGKGTYQTDSYDRAVDADFDLSITETAQLLSIKDCWTYADPELGMRSACYSTEFTVDANAQLFIGQSKVGDIFPGQISVFRGNDQVSELMNFGLDNVRNLTLHYSYNNMDGGISVRFAKLVPNANSPL